MSEFSELLSQFIREKDIKVYSMVKYCRLDRSTMYKLINGKRNPPSEEIFNKIAEFMCLTPSEYQKFQEAYQITRLGRDTYYKRKAVEKFLLSFPNSSCLPILPPPVKLQHLLKKKSAIICQIVWFLQANLN